MEGLPKDVDRGILHEILRGSSIAGWTISSVAIWTCSASSHAIKAVPSQTCIQALKDAPPIAKTRLQWRKADLSIGRSGVDATETATSAPVTLDEGDIELPDILTDLQDKTQLTRRSIHRIIMGSDRLDDFKRNPQQFIELAAEIINRSKRLALVDGIKYQRIGAEVYYAQQLFETEELTGYLKSMIDANKAVYEQVIYQSDTERTFAEQLEKNEAIKVYAKLPGWFRVPTPYCFSGGSSIFRSSQTLRRNLSGI